MTPVPELARDLVRATENRLPAIVARAGKSAVFAADEFFFGRIRNEHTRRAYFSAVKRFLASAEASGLELVEITPKFAGQYLDQLRKTKLSVATCKQHLAALRHFFDGMVTRHAIILNPALSVRGERYELMRGFFPGVTDAADVEFDGQQPRMQSILIDEGAAGVGKTIEMLRMEELGIQIAVLRRKGVRETKLQPEMRLQSGDVLVLAGTPEALARAEMRLLQG